jgi:hypothetical protein
LTNTRRTATLGLAMAMLIGLLGWPAEAHHGWSSYDQARTLTVTGTIKESTYEHPHGSVRLEAGEKTWLVVLAPPSRMEVRGLPKTMLAAGKTATVVGYPHRTVAEEMRAERITIDGKTTELR